MPEAMELLEFLPGAVYYLSSHAPPTEATVADGNDDGHNEATPYRMEYIHVEKEFPYQSFYLDFGPLHLGHIFVFARQLNERLDAIGYDGCIRDGDNEEGDDEDGATNNQSDASVLDCRICVSSSLLPHHRANAVCLLGCWAILFRKWTADRAFAPFKHLFLPPFHDASPHSDSFGLTVFHVLKGLERAVHSGFFPSGIEAFDETAFLDDMDPDKRDLTWITPRMAAFAGPQSVPNGYSRAKPNAFIDYFVSNGVTLVVRLNKPKYDEKIFVREGIQVEELYFPDGTCPSDTVVRRFLELCDSHGHTKIAVHCKAGLGRTGTLIGVHLMRRFRFSAAEAIGWLRLCRPGSVIGSQQHFLRQLEVRISTIHELSDLAFSKHDSETNNPEDGELSVDSIHERRHLTKGIAARSKSSGVSFSSPSTPTSLSRSPAALPPKIPGRRATPSTPSSPSTLSSPKLSQGDSLLQRKQVHTLPLGISLWPQAPSIVGS